MPAQTTKNDRGIVTPPFIATYNGNAVYTQPHEALPAVTTVQKHGLVNNVVPHIEDCYFRMLNVDEIRAAMGFRDDYILKGTNRDKVKLCGHAVTPSAASVLLERMLVCVS